MSKAQSRRRRRPLLSVLIGVIALSLTGWNMTIMVRGFTAQQIQRLRVEELASDQAGYLGRTVMLSGLLVRHSLVRSAPCVYDFLLESGRITIPVRFAQCVVPGSFHRDPQADVKLSARGRLLKGWHFEAEAIARMFAQPFYLRKRPPESDDWRYADAGSNGSDAGPD
jgi:cytochrome c-type biogenesis protein CcmE